MPHLRSNFASLDIQYAPCEDSDQTAPNLRWTLITEGTFSYVAGRYIFSVAKLILTLHNKTNDRLSHAANLVEN